ncbi:hypothetical protein KAZ57_03900, partial [Patescibacteria group bacterium]|nr:hypothetical protein [Patescibacteria group bacterium]
IEASGIDQILAIESGVIATYKIPANEYFILQLSGKPSLNALQNPDMGSITKTNPVLNISGSVDIKQSPLNYEDRAIQANYQSALYLDRAVAVTYDKKTNTTFIGISRGVTFPPDAVKEAICDNKGKERVSEAMRKNLIKNGLLATDGTILEGPLTGQKFDVQDPHNFLTNCEMSRHMQITEILLAVFEEIKKKKV